MEAKPRGAFLNTEPAICSIFESGRMVFDCLKGASEYALDYITLDEIDLEYFGQHSKFRLKKSPDKSVDTVDTPADYSFWILNYHPATMAPYFPAEWLRHLPGKKFSIVLEVEPDDPIKHVRAADFDNHIVLDPTAVRSERVTAFARPLNGVPQRGRPPTRGIPVIGSFGLGTPGKGFEHLVEAVNREFDAAIVRINVPVSTYADDVMFSVHQRPYAENLEALCKRVAKPGIEVQFSRRFMESTELVDWCAENDLNCFFYTRRQSGLSATTDQCILSGQPLLVTSNDTFRHIHKYIQPYPRTGLREAMTVTRPAVSQMQLDWSPRNFQSIFVDLLRRSDLLSPKSSTFGNSSRATPAAASREPPLIAFLVPPDAELGDPVHYFQRAIDAVSRTGEFRVISYTYEQVAELTDFLFWRSPTVIVICAQSTEQAFDGAALKNYRGRLFVLPSDMDRSEEWIVERFGDLLGRKPELIGRRPIIPYFTALPSVPPGQSRICLFGFRHPSSNLEQLISKIQREDGTAYIEIVRTRAEEGLDDVLFAERLQHLAGQLKLTPLMQVHVVDQEHNANQLIHWIGSHHLCIIANDSRYTEELYDICEMALTTERAVAFTRYSPFPAFAGGLHVEDTSIQSLVKQASAVQAALYNEYSEGRFAKEFLSLLNDEPQGLAAIVKGAMSGGGQVVDGQPWVGVLDEEMAAWLSRAYESSASLRQEQRASAKLQATHVEGQQAFLIAAVEVLSRRTEGARVLFAGDPSRTSVASLIERGYDLAPLWGAAGDLASQPACVFNSCAVSGFDEAERFFHKSNEVLPPGGAGALTFFVRPAFAADDPRENPDFPVIDPMDLVALLSRFGLSLIGQPDWRIRRPAFSPRQFDSPLLGAFLFQKPFRSVGGVAR